MASGSAGSIYVDLLLRDSGFQQGLRRANSNSRQAFGAITHESRKAQSALVQTLNPISNISASLGILGATVASTLSVQKIIQYSDTWRQLEGRLRIVETDMQAVGAAQEALFEIAQRNRSPLDNVINFYQRLNQFIPEAVRGQYDLLSVTESVTAALAITGENSMSAQAAMIQLSQAVGTNFEAAGQELRSIQEQAPRLAQAITNALGGGSKSLQQLVEDGILTRDTFLRVFDGVSEESKRLAEEMAKIPLTVGQAFTRLDNAFLKFIGQSELVDQGASSIAVAISSLAENLDVVADVATTAGIAFTARYIPALVASATTSLTTAGTVLSLNLAIGQLAFGSTAAATAMLGLRGAALALGAAWAIAVPAAAVLALYEVIDGNESLIASERELADVISDTGRELDEVFRKHGKLTDEAKDQVRQRIESYRDEVLALEQVLKAQLDNQSNLALLVRGIKDFAGETVLEGIFGRDYESLDEVVKKQQNYNEAIRELNELLDKPRTVSGSVPTEMTKKQRQEAEKLARELQSLYEKNERYIQGLSKEQYDYNRQIEEFNRLWQQGKISYEEYVTAVDNYQDELRQKTLDTFIDMEAISKRAAENMQDAFANFLFNPFEDGLKGMLRSFVETMQKMLAQQLSSSLFRQIAGSALGAAGSALFSGGFNNAGQAGLPWQGFGNINPQGGVYSGNFGGFFADGGFLKPGQWGIAGEQGAEMIYGGRTGATVIPNGGNGKSGNTYNIDARGADEGAVRRLEAALMSLAGPGQIEKRVSNAQRRGAL